MSVADGEDADQTTFNTSFWSREIDTSTVGKVDLNESSSTVITDLQGTLNSEFSEIDSLRTLSGTSLGDNNLGTFTGSTISDSLTIKAALQEVEDETESIRTMSGTAVGDNDLGTFSGSTISNNATVKSGMQEIETAVELRELSSNKGIANGYASLDANVFIPLVELPSPAISTAAALLHNVAPEVAVSAGELTLTLRQADGISSGSATDPIKIGYRDTDLTKASYTVDSHQVFTDLILPSGATLGYANGDNAEIHVYTIINAGATELMLAGSRFFRDDDLISTTAIGVGSDSGIVAFSTAARTNVPVRYIGFFVVNAITTAGVWTAPDKGSTLKRENFHQAIVATAATKVPTASGTFQLHTGNSIVMTPGTYNVWLYVKYDSVAGNADHENTRLQLGGANGADNATIPAAASTLAGVTIDFGEELQTPFEDSTTGTSFITYTAMNYLRVTLAETQTIFVNTFWGGGGLAANARVTPRIWAERLI